jgi:hypothetical protein
MHSKELTTPDGRHLTFYSTLPIPDGIDAPGALAGPAERLEQRA